jgi:PhoPQ-activated pathogenicity-related protein
VAGTVFTQLLNDKLARPDYNINNQHHLTSYSMQSDNTYRYYFGDYSTDFSGYYIKVIVLILMVTLGIMLMSHLPPLFVRPRRTARTLRIIAKLIKIRTRPA